MHLQDCSGTITVYLSLILLLILSLVLTLIEGARIQIARVNTERSLTTAMDSVLAEYYGPLWEEYHIFGYNSGTSNEDEQKDQICDKISEYMSYTLHPNKELGVYGRDNVDLYQTSLNAVTVDSKTILTDYQGELLINEAVEYMKYREAGNGLENLFGRLSLMEEPRKVSYVCEEKQKVEEELVEIDKGVLELMKLLDGLSTSNKGIKITKDNKLKPVELYVKKICYEEIAREAVGINQDQVFLALKEGYLNPTTDFLIIDSALKEINELQSCLRSINERKVDNKINGEPTDKGKVVDKEVEKYTTEIAQLTSTVIASKQKLTRLITGIIPIIDRAIQVIDTMAWKAQKAKPLIDHYEKLLNNYENQIEGETYSGLEDGLREMKKYISASDTGYNFSYMKEILIKDSNILKQTEESINQGYYAFLMESYGTAKDSFAEASSILSTYQIKGLTLDYSTLVLDHSEKENAISSICNLLNSGITGLITDPEKLSRGVLTHNALPSEIAAMSSESTDYLSELTNIFKNYDTGDESFGMGDLFRSFIKEANIKDVSKQAINKVTEHLLYQGYIQEHFKDFIQSIESTSQKPSALSYEQEYMLIGKNTDKENIETVISRIVLLRTMADLVSIIGDSTKRNEARITAAAMVGFTGLPILITVTQGLILLAWSLAEALLDTCALLKGKNIPVLKKEIILQLPEVLMINRSFLDSKVSSITNTKDLSMSYKDYLSMFLVMKNQRSLAYRSLDLMQENIKLRYGESSFDIMNCWFGYEARIDYTLPPKFTVIPVVQKILGKDKIRFCFQSKAAYSY